MPQILLCCVLALLLAALGLLLRSLHRRFRPSGGNETLKVLLVCFFTCGILLHLPMYAAAYAGEHLSWLKALLGAVHHTLRMFVLDGELDPIHEFAMTQPAVWSDLYFGAAIVVYLVSPLLTFSVVLSFFKNLSAMWRYAFRRCTELYVFSELNEDSLYLAGSIKAAHPKGLIVFTDVYENESEEFGEQMAAAHRLGAACFKTDIALLRLRRSDRSRPVYFFLMGRDKAENIHQAVLLTRRWGTRSNMHLYLFATGAESELLFQSADPHGMRDVNHHQLDTFLAWIKPRRIQLRFIELTGEGSELFRRHHISGMVLRDELLKRGWIHQIRQRSDGPAQVFCHPDYEGEIGLIMPYEKDFCASCNRLRVSSVGKLHLCLFGDGGVDLRDLLEDDAQQDALEARISEALTHKKQTHFLHQGNTGITQNLSYIGG